MTTGEELVLSSGRLPRARQLGYGAVAEAVSLVARDPGRWPRKRGNATGIGPDTISDALFRHGQAACALLADLDPDSDTQLPMTIAEHAEMARLDPEASDVHSVVFDQANRLVPPIALALLVRDGEIERPRSFAIRFRAVRCDARKQRPGVWRSHQRGATFVEAALVAEGRRQRPAGEAAARFDRYAVQIVSVPVERWPGERNVDMIVRVVDELLGVVDRGAELLAADGEPAAAALLTETPVTADAVRYGAPPKRRSLLATSEEDWLGVVHELWDLLRSRRRPAALALFAGLDPTAAAAAGDSPIDYSSLVFDTGTGNELFAMIEQLAAAPSSRDADRALARLRAEPVDERMLRAANIDDQEVDWYAVERELVLRGAFGSRPTHHRLLLRRTGLGAVHAYALNHTPTQTMLEAADSSFTHGTDPYVVCMNRQTRRFGSAIELSGRCTHATWSGLIAALLTQNLLFVAAARERARTPA